MNELAKEDRRVRKTKRALRECLAELMLDKELRNITVRELTDKADIHRATFYIHYKDIYDLYNQIQDAVIHELNEVVFENSLSHPNDYYELLFDYIVENKHICRMLFSNNQNNQFFVYLTSLFKKTSLDIWLKAYNVPKSNEALEFYAQYHLMGCLSIISRWVQTNFEYSRDKLVAIISDIDTNFESFLKSKIEAFDV